MRNILRLHLLILLFMPVLAKAWWNGEWTQRQKITVKAPAGAGQPLTGMVVPVRLHTGNFMFADAQPQGQDLRFVAGDDKTPLQYQVESFDGVNELALIWVRLPDLPAGKEETLWLYYGNAKAPAAAEAGSLYDAARTLNLRFGDAGPAPKDAGPHNHAAAQSSAKLSVPGLLGQGARFDGQSSIVFDDAPTLRAEAGKGLSFSAWVKPAEAQPDAVLLSRTDGRQSLVIGLAGGKPYARLSGATAAELVSDTMIAPGGWHQIAATLGDAVAIYVDGKPAGTAAAAATPALAGPTVIGGGAGAGFKGDMDEVVLAAGARPAEWIAAHHGAQAADGALLTVGESEGAEAAASAEGEGSYFQIILSSVTLDGWIVIGILLVMMVIAFWVMVAKAVFVERMDKANVRFRSRFKRMHGGLISMDRGDVDDEDVEDLPGGRRYGSVGAMAVEPAPVAAAEADAREFRHSSLYRIYHTGVAELKHRFELYDKARQPRRLTGAAIDSIKAAMDASLVREMHRLNSQIVLLTIAISGGPFLGLLGTVVGVMITFAAIAAVGDVNVNAIAPGIAAALVATVAGLAVAIPALFGYNYLTSRIKSISADMQVFADEFVTKLAEEYSL